MGKNTRLICHLMNNMRQEVGTAKTKIHSQQFQWRKGMWAIPNDATAWIDKKGTSHMFFEVNESDGTIRFLHARKDNIIDDKCIKCGGRISIDAKNAWDMLKRKTINAIWGVDQSHIVLLIIMGIVCISAIAGIMYLLGNNTKLQEQNTKLQNDHIALLEKYSTLPPKFILGGLFWQ